MLLWDFLHLDVINIADGNRIGRIVDVNFLMPVGQVESLIVSNCPRRIWKFWYRKEDIVIPWSNVVTVGVDAILVNIVC